MKVCPVCALELEDTYLFCPDDGSILAASASDGSSTKRANGDRYPPAFLSGAPETEHHGFRIAAIATMIALAVFALVALYALGSSLSRRPSVAAKTASQTESVPFVVTPQAAQDQKEEQPAASTRDESPQSPAAAQIVERTHKEVSSSANEQRNRKTSAPLSVPTASSPIAPAPTTASRVSNPPAPVLRPADAGEFDSRLVRARSSKTSSGYRYDLTFNMQEQRGHSAQWQRVLITTKSASGANHTQAIPFVHRLGAAGALTFTISVELTGRSEADWRGRINCTTLGWDNTGAPLQATFVANVTP